MAIINLGLTDEQRALKSGVIEICKRYPGEYWRDLDSRREYPEKFVNELTQAGYRAALIPQEFGGAGLPIEKPEITAEISRRRVERAKGAGDGVDALVSACPWPERPLSAAGDAAQLEVLDLFELLARSAGIEVGGRTRAPGQEAAAR